MAISGGVLDWMGHNVVMVTSVDEIYRRLADLNAELRRGGDDARVRFASVEPDPDFVDGSLVLITWELPDPARGQDVWSLDELDGYSRLVVERLVDLASTECLFRTRADLAATLSSASASLSLSDRFYRCRWPVSFSS